MKNKLFKWKIIIGDDLGYRGTTHFAKTRLLPRLKTRDPPLHWSS